MSANLATPVQSTSVCIRAFEPTDAAKICDLFSRHTCYRRDIAFWLWLNRTLPVRPAIVAVAEMDGNVVGHYGILPLELRSPSGATLLAGHGVHAFVSPEFRDRVSIFQISAHAYELARDAGVAFVFGFPNSSYRLIQEKIERWRCISTFQAWRKPADSSQRSAGEAMLVPADLNNAQQLETAISLWESLDSSPGAIAPAGQTRWWTLRYLLHPQRPYEVFWYVRQGRRSGILVTKRFHSAGEVRAHIVDYALAGGEAHAGLLAAFEAAFGSRAGAYVHWPVEPGFVKAMQEAGYTPDGFETFFGLRWLNSPVARPANGDPWLQAAAWRIPMGLSDAF